MESVDLEVIPVGVGGEVKKAKLHKKAKWQPKRWDPLYDQMVALSCTGLSNKAIAGRFGYTDQQVCNILTSDQGRLIKQLVSQYIQDQLKDETARRIIETERRANDIIHAVLNDNELLAKNPIAMYDRAIKFLEGRGQLEDKSKTPVSNHTVIIGSDLGEKLIAGLAKANEAVMLHKGVEVRKLSDGLNGSDKRGVA